MDIQTKYESLKNNLKHLGSLCVAFSGGVDSAFLLAVARNVLGDRCIAVTVNSSMNMRSEFEEAKEFAANLRVKHIVVDANEYSIKEFVENGKERCYYCKHAIFSKIKDVAEQNGIQYVADGSNADDSNDYRPGMKAIKELEVVSPLKAVGLTKQEIRVLSKDLGLPTWDKPSFACLASRIPYGVQITPQILTMIGQCEEFLVDLGFKQFRVRYHGDVARIEVLQEDIHRLLDDGLRNKIVARFKESGFTYVSLDLEGYRTGSMNEVL